MTEPRKTNIIQIDDGTKEFSVVNRFGQEICKVHIRTSDMSILDRIRDLQKAMPEIVSGLEEVDIRNDGKAEDTIGYEVLRKAEKRMAEELSKVFDTDEIRKIFEKRSMFSPINSEFFVTVVINALIDQIVESVAEETKKTTSRMGKYLKVDGKKG